MKKKFVVRLFAEQPRQIESLTAKSKVRAQVGLRAARILPKADCAAMACRADRTNKSARLTSSNCPPRTSLVCRRRPRWCLEYHTSADNLKFVHAGPIESNRIACIAALSTLENNLAHCNHFPTASHNWTSVAGTAGWVTPSRVSAICHALGAFAFGCLPSLLDWRPADLEI